MEQKVSQEQVQKALSALKGMAGESIAKGAKGPTTEPSGQASGVGTATQLPHGKGNDFDAVKTFAGTTTETASFGGEYASNGTDVSVGSFAKSVLEMVAAGKISATDAATLLKAVPFAGKETEEEEEAEEKVDEKMEKKKADKKVEKSLADIASEDADVSEMINVSKFLEGLVDVISKALETVEGRIIKSVISHIDSTTAAAEGFNKSLAGAVVALGEGLTATASRVSNVEKEPARAPKSAEVNLAKSIGGSENLSRNEVLETLTEMATVTKSINALEVIKFEGTGEISNDLLKAVVAHRSNKR